MRATNDTITAPWLDELEVAIRSLSRERARDALRMVASFGLLPGAPIEGGELSRAAIDGPLAAPSKA